MKSRAFHFLLAALAFGSTHAAETLSVVPDSAQALSTVGGRFANLSDASATRVSPANIVEIERPELLLNLAAWNGDIRFDGATSSSVKMSQSWVYPGSLYFVAPIIPKKVAFGFGISSPFGMAATFPKQMDPQLRYTIPYEGRLLALDFTPAVSFKVAKNFNLAIGMDIIYSELTLGRIYPWFAGPFGPGPNGPEGELEMKGSGWGVGGYAGINWEFAKGHRLAIVGRLPVTINYEGEHKFSNIPAAAQIFGGFSDRGSFQSDMTFPGSIAVGYGVDVTDRLTLGFDFQWSDNSSHDDIPLDLGNNQPLLGGANGAALSWKDSIDLGMGVTYKLNKSWSLRGGYLYSENSQPELNYIPSAAVNDRHVFGLGVGWRGETRSVDLAYAYVFNPIRTIGSNADPALNGNYKHQWHVLSLSITQKF